MNKTMQRAEEFSTISLYKFELAKSIMRFFLIGAIFWMFEKYVYTKEYSSIMQNLPFFLLATNIVYTLFLVILKRKFLVNSRLLRIFHYISLVFCPIAFSLIIRFTGNENSVFTLFYYFYLVVIPLAQINFKFYETVVSEILIIAAYPVFLWLLKPPTNLERVFWQIGFEILIATAMVVLASIIRKEKSELEKLTEKLETMAITDSLTGLYNRRFIQETLPKEIKRSTRSGKPLSLAIGDLDFFKSINDKYGHLEGDSLLQLVAKIIVDNVRESDLAARFGGEEFLIVFPETSKEEACEITERLREKIEKETKERYGKPLTISFGIATFPEDGLSETEILKRADRALYEAKRLGKNRIVICKGMLG